MPKKWYEFIVSVDRPQETQVNPIAEEFSKPDKGAVSAAQTVADIAKSVAPVTEFKSSVRDPTSFEQIYGAAEIRAPSQGYTILKIAEMLQSEHIRSLPVDVKRSSILLALEAAGVKIQDVIEDAVRRDRALDTYEKVLEKSVHELEARKQEENRKIEAELERLVADYRNRLQANNDELAKEKDRFFSWRIQKQQEEKRIADAVGHFVTENPITLGSTSAPAQPKKNDSKP